MSNETKIFIGVIGGTLLLIFGLAFALGGKSPATSPTGSAVVDEKLLVKSDSWKSGSDSAKVTVVEFSDFQCPACKAAQPTVQSLLTKYGNNLRFVYRHFPLPSHEFGFSAAEAAEAAGLQGKPALPAGRFWEMHDKLFDISPDLGKDKLVQAAKDLGLNIDKFNKDMDSDSIRQKVLNDQTDGNTLGVNATPTFFVNGTKLVGAADLDKEISSRLQQ